MAEPLLFHTAASFSLAKDILRETPSLHPGKCRLGNFSDGEIMFYLDEPVKGKPCFVLGHTGPPTENLLSIFTIINTLKINGAKPITAVVPFWGYARSDRDKPLQPINSRLFAGLLKQAGATEIICLDLHSLLNKNYFTIPVIHLSALPVMAGYFTSKKFKNLAVVAPDLGGVNRAKLFAGSLGKNEIAVIQKYRPSVSSAMSLRLTGEVNGKNVVLVDDMIQTGNTLLSAARFLKTKGAKDLYVAVTHCVYQSKGINLLTSTSLFKKIYITNSQVPTQKLPPKVIITDISPLLAKAIKNEVEKY